MSDQIWVGFILFSMWFLLPLTMIIANWEFNGDSVVDNPKFKEDI
ncbi:MAG: hypothetical protein ACO20H_00155 [Bacteriovoracaceae bacterium]